MASSFFKARNTFEEEILQAGGLHGTSVLLFQQVEQFKLESYREVFQAKGNFIVGSYGFANLGCEEVRMHSPTPWGGRNGLARKA